MRSWTGKIDSWHLEGQDGDPWRSTEPPMLFHPPTWMLSRTSIKAQHFLEPLEAVEKERNHESVLTVEEWSASCLQKQPGVAFQARQGITEFDLEGGTIGALCVDAGASRPPSFLHLGRTGMGYPLCYELLSSLQVTGKNLPDFEMIILKWGYELPSPQKVRGSGVHLSLGVFTFSETALLLTLKLHISEGLKLG